MSRNIDLSKIQNLNENDDIFTDSDDESIAPKKKGNKLNIKQNEQSQIEDEFQQRMDRLMQLPQEPSPEDIIYKQKLITKIIQYKQIFFELLRSVSFDDLENKSITELETLLHKTKEIVQNRNMMSNIRNGVQLAPQVFEHIAVKYTPLKLQGYANALNNDPEYYFQVNELLLEYDILDGIKFNPMHRLAYTLMSTALLTHQANTIKEKNINFNKEVPDEIKNKYSGM